MDLIPQRQSLLSSTVAVLREAIVRGEWVQHLPGERKLCGRMRVGRDTLRLALKQLEREGLIGKGDPGKRRLVLSGGSSVVQGSLGGGKGGVAYLTPHRPEHLSETTFAEIDMVRGQLVDSGIRLEIVNSRAFEMRRPSSVLKELVIEQGARVWILHQTTAAMQRWFFENAVPCLLHGLAHDGVDLPFVDLDYFAIGRHAGGFLSGRGHERVVMVRPGARLRGLDLAEAGLGEALKLPLLVVKDGGDAAGMARQLDLVMRMGNRPTALVATRSWQVLTVISHLARLGMKVPKDLSIVVLDYEPYHEYLTPQVACYRVDVSQTARLVVRKVLELAGSGSMTRKVSALMPDFTEGGSVSRN